MKNSVGSTVLASLFAACASSATPETAGPVQAEAVPVPQAAAATCELAAANVVGQLGATDGITEEDFAANRTPIETALSSECDSSGWAEEVRNCFADAVGLAVLEDCRNQLTAEQQESMTTNMSAALGGKYDSTAEIGDLEPIAR